MTALPSPDTAALVPAGASPLVSHAVPAIVPVPVATRASPKTNSSRPPSATHTRRAYARIVDRFLLWCEQRGLELVKITPDLAGEFINTLEGSTPTKNQALAALRHFFDAMVNRHAVVLNPFASVRGIRHSVMEGRTAEISIEQARTLLRSIDTAHVVGLRDRAVIGVLAYTGARVGAIAKLRLVDYRDLGDQRALRFQEKGGKEREIPVRRDLEAWLRAYIEAAGIEADPKTTPLFRSAERKKRALTDQRFSDHLMRQMLERRLKNAGLPELFSPHSFRVAVVTDLLKQDVPLEDVQVLLGLSGAGAVADFVPNSVIKGMLAAIGLVIILKQIPHALGRDRDFEGDFSFFDKAGGNTLSDIVSGFQTASPGAVTISLVSIAVLLAWDRMAYAGRKFFKVVPGPLVVVALGILMNEAFGWLGTGLKLTDPDHLVALPVLQGPNGFLSPFTAPDFHAIYRKEVWIAAATLAIVGSLESLLSVEAADRLDPYRRISPPNRELRAQGIGNAISGLLGGLPVTSVVVRTSANVYAGARTWVSSFVHVVLLFGSAMLIPHILNLTPLASLAAVLIMLGYKLTNLKLYKNMRSLGADQYAPFLITVAAIVFTDLLKGVLIGLAVGLLFVIRANRHAAFTVVSQDHWYLLRFNKDATFVNKGELRTKLRAIPDNSILYLDATRSPYIDRDIIEVIEDFQKSAPYKNIGLEIKNLHGKALRKQPEVNNG